MTDPCTDAATAATAATAARAPDDGPLGDGGSADQYLTFRLGAEEYGVAILRVQCIQVWEDATPIPGAPPWVLGVTNLRGAIVPIVDLRRRFDLANWSFGPTTVVIVVSVESAAQTRTVGMVVDGVSEVCALHEHALQPAPDFAGALDTRFVRGIACIDDRMLVVLDVDGLLHDAIAAPTGDDTSIAASAASAA